MGKQHKLRGTPTYNSWRSMKSRCLNPNDPAYPRYGGRGISIEPRWLDFREFLKDMGERPTGTQLDREKNDVGYEPGNCRWVTPKVNVRNRRCTQRAPDGTPLAVLAEASGVHLDTLVWRIKRGIDISVAVSTPANTTNRFIRS